MSVRQGDYVMVDHPIFGERCPLLAEVKEIKNYEEVVGTTLTEKSIETMATGEIIGYVDLREPQARPLHELFAPPTPGSKVYLPYFEFLEDVFVRDADGRLFPHALHVGDLETFANSQEGAVKPLRFYLNAEDFKWQHLLITAISGVGKTHTATVIAEELANKTDSPLVILDAHGEYTTLGIAGTRFTQLATEGDLSANDYPFDFSVTMYACDCERVRDTLARSGVAVEKKGRFNVKPVAGRWTQTSDEAAERTMTEGLRKDVRSKQVTILDSHGLSPDEKRCLYTGCVKALWNGRVDGSVGPFVLVVEEAETLETETLERVASEGRRVGLSLCLLTQHPTAMSDTVLSQMGAQMMGRTTDARDLEYLRNMAMEKVAVLPKLTTGEWIINGITMRRPTKVLARDRYSVECHA
jgi:hypothetical protein